LYVQEPSAAAVRETLTCFRELGLTALVLHHIDPARFAMCSHHLASLLFVSGRTVPEFYVDYCKELLFFSQMGHRRPKLTVVETEFALWTWYWFAHRSGNADTQKRHYDMFSKDRSVQKRRSTKIRSWLQDVDKLDLARSYLDTEPTVAAIIAWREFETELRRILVAPNDKMPDLIKKIDLKPEALPDGWTRKDLTRLWSRTGCGRDLVMHCNQEVSPKDATTVLDLVIEFIDHNGLE
jgi:hypothetical protein